MGFKLGKSKALTPPDKNTTTQLSTHTTKTTGPALAHSSQNGSATYAESGGRAAATSRHGSAWSKSIAYGGDPSSSSSSSNQVSSRQTHTYTSGNAIAGVIKGGTFAYAGPGGYGEAAYRDGSRFGASVAYGGEKKGGGIQFRRSDLASSGQSRIEISCASSGDEGDDSDG